MLLRVLDLRGTPPPFDDVLPRPDAPGADVHDAVAGILAEVRADGDAALVRCTAAFDRVDVADGLRVSAATITEAADRVDPGVRGALETAFGRIVAYHADEGTAPGDHSDGGITVRHLTRPVARAGLYAPGGRARYPSTVLMCAAPARVAGVGSLALCVPPAADGSVDDATLCAALVAGVDEVYRVGGAQAIGALAYGTDSIRAVDVIAGPGNAYVAEAKRQVSGVVGVASAFAGPSEIVVVAGPEANPEFAAVDLVVQAEHGPGGLAWLVTWDPALLERIIAEVARIVEASARRADLESTLGTAGLACLVDGPDAALAVADVIAPEHLQLLVPEEAGMAMLDGVHNAGAVFVGPWSPASMGDYIAGPNHVLPTNRTARFASALRADDFRKHLHAVRVTPAALRTLGPAVVTLAETEGLPAHADSVRWRLDALDAAGDAVSAVPPVRPDLQLTEGYHSPQVEAEVRLNTNESPFGPPDAWREELLAALEEVSFHRYPDRPATELRRAVADLHGVGADEVFCANGSNEVLQCLLLAFGGPGRTALVFEPTYALHAHIARITGTEVVEGSRDDDFQIDREDARSLLERRQPEIVFLCSPNNPTGRAEPPETVAAVGAAAPGLLIVDEAYGQFAPWSALELRGRDQRGLVVTRTFSKTWAMAGARLGYLVAEAAVVAACEAVVLPYHLSAQTQAAGLLALRHVAEMESRVARIAEERGRVAAALADLPVDTWPSDANFILFRPRDRDADAVWRALLARSVLIRNCASWDGLRGCLRVTIGTAEENDRFLHALKESL